VPVLQLADDAEQAQRVESVLVEAGVGPARHDGGVDGDAGALLHQSGQFFHGQSIGHE
jgi:hypothetical protein